MMNLSTTAQERRKGFALVIALVLMAYILLLMVSFSTLTMVEVRKAAIQQDLVLARQNALFGLKMALVQLQEEAGPDQRTTARADILGEVGGGGNAPVDEKRYWTGVWRSDLATNPAWLVSRSSTSDHPSNPFTEPEYTRVKVLGGGSAAVDVLVELLPIPDTDSANTPGGRYAYWVGDEGLKAKVNLVSSPSLSAPVGSDGSRSPLISAQRFGIENMDNLATMADYLSPGIASDQALIVQNLNHYRDLRLLNENLSEADLKQRYFDLTTFSYGVLSNSRDGGLRRDLTHKLSDQTTPGGYIFAEDSNRPSNQRIGPEWELLQDYYQLSDSISGISPVVKPRFVHPVLTGGSSLAGSVYGDHATAVNVMPVPVFTGLTFGLYLEVEGAETFRLQLMIKPVVALWNPYDVILDSEDYMVEFYPEDNPRTIHQRTPAIVLRNESSDNRNWTVHINELLPGYEGTNSNSSTVNNLHFYVTSGTLQPGEIQWYSLPDGTGGSYSEGIFLSAGFHPGAYVSVPIHPQSGYRPGVGWARNAGVDIGLVHESDLAESNQFGLGPNIGRYGVRWHHGTLPISTVDENSVFHYTRVTGRSGGPFTMAIAQKGPAGELVNLFPDIVSTGVLLYGPHRTDRYLGQSLESSGIKVLSNYNVRSVHNSTLFDDSSIPNGLAWRTDAPTYGQVSVHGGALAFDEAFLWDTDAITDEGYRMVLFHLPREPLLSIGQFQHLDVSRSVWEPAYVIGNSYASPWISPEETESALTDWTLYDSSYLLNDMIWDRYFFSTWNAPDSPQDPIEAPGNLRMQIWSFPEDEEGISVDQSAAHLLVNGPFNVNSTSVEAWKGFLSGLNQQAIAYRDSVTAQTVEVQGLLNPYFRTPYPGGGAMDYWRGYRELTDVQLTNLAGQIVHQVRERGPFLTIGQFVNRSLDGQNLERSLKGPLQAAIDSVEPVVIDGITYGPPAINPSVSNAASVSTAPAELNYAFAEAARGVLSQNATGYITQADILSVLGATLTTRSDTFVIRAYGEVVNTLLGGNAPSVTARAWCEAVVQRIPEYVDPSQDPSDPAIGINVELGRRFEIISFKWLTPDEV